jgi:hypothetical protein
VKTIAFSDLAIPNTVISQQRAAGDFPIRAQDFIFQAVTIQTRIPTPETIGRLSRDDVHKIAGVQALPSQWADLRSDKIHIP